MHQLTLDRLSRRSSHYAGVPWQHDSPVIPPSASHPRRTRHRCRAPPCHRGAALSRRIHRSAARCFAFSDWGMNASPPATTLYFGCRSRSKDLLFANDWARLEASGALRLRLAASRDQVSAMSSRDWASRRTLNRDVASGREDLRSASPAGGRRGGSRCDRSEGRLGLHLGVRTSLPSRNVSRPLTKTLFLQVLQCYASSRQVRFGFLPGVRREDVSRGRGGVSRQDGGGRQAD